MPDEPVNVQNLHEVTKWTEERMSDGTFRRCAHFRVISIQQGGSLGRTQVFVPDCARRSFNWRFQATDRQDELYILVNMLHAGVINCPSDCVNFVGHWRPLLGGAVSKLKWCPES